MKKAKWATAILGIPMLCIGVLWVDFYYRAAAAIQAEEERLARDIAEFRSRVKSSGIDSRLASARFPMTSVTLEQAVRSQQAHLAFGPYFQYLGAGQPTFMIQNPYESLSLDECVAALAMHQERLRECGSTTVSFGKHFDHHALEGIRAAIQRPDVPPEHFRRTAQAMDRLFGARLSMREILEAERIREMAEALAVLRLKADPIAFFHRGPGWRELFSWRILVARSLQDIDDRFRKLQAMETTPIQKWIEQARRLGGDLPLTESACSSIERFLDREARAIAAWEYTRVVVALQWFQAERGSAPALLDELLPKYLPKIPPHPVDGTPLRYKDGTLTSSFGDSEETMEWTMRTP